jgi:hypothetical protein
MSSASSDAILISYLKTVLSEINFYFGMFIFCFGIVGNILNILTLCQRSLRSNPCVIIFLASSVAGIIAILSGLTSRVLSGVTTDLSATFDRWLLSCVNVHYRQMSSIKNSFRGIIIIIIASIILLL